jgi:hypothetical protein
MGNLLPLEYYVTCDHPLPILATTLHPLWIFLCVCGLDIQFFHCNFNTKEVLWHTLYSVLCLLFLNSRQVLVTILSSNVMLILKFLTRHLCVR